MHPEIKEFWAKIGLVDFTLSAPTQYYVVEFYNSNLCITIAEVWNGGSQDGPEQPAKYFYNNEQYSEGEMLKIIKLKAFL